MFTRYNRKKVIFFTMNYEYFISIVKKKKKNIVIGIGTLYNVGCKIKRIETTPSETSKKTTKIATIKERIPYIDLGNAPCFIIRRSYTIPLRSSRELR